MEVQLSTSEIFLDVRNEFLLEVREDPKLMASLDAGAILSENNVERAFVYAASVAKTICRRFLIDDEYATSGSNAISIPQTYTINLCMSERRMKGKTQAIAGIMHTLFVDLMLSKLYAQFAPDLVKLRDACVVDDRTSLEEMLYSKGAPC